MLENPHKIKGNSIPKKLGKFKQPERPFHDQILDIADMNNKSLEEFKELKQLLNSQHAIDEIFHAKELARLFPDAPQIGPDHALHTGKIDPTRQAVI